jgi:hypothetical protein
VLVDVPVPVLPVPVVFEPLVLWACAMAGTAAIAATARILQNMKPSEAHVFLD